MTRDVKIIFTPIISNTNFVELRTDKLSASDKNVLKFTVNYGIFQNQTISRNMLTNYFYKYLLLDCPK